MPEHNFRVKIMIFAFKSEKLCIKNEKLCIKTRNFVFKMMKSAGHNHTLMEFQMKRAFAGFST